MFSRPCKSFPLFSLVLLSLSQSSALNDCQSSAARKESSQTSPSTKTDDHGDIFEAIPARDLAREAVPFDMDSRLSSARRRQRMIQNQQLDLPRMKEDTLIQSIRMPSFKASLWAKRAIDGDVGLSEMHKVYQDVVAGRKSFLDAEEVMTGIIANARAQQSQPPGVRAFNQLIRIAEVEAERGEWLSSAMAFHVRCLPFPGVGASAPSCARRPCLPAS